MSGNLSYYKSIREAPQDQVVLKLTLKDRGSSPGEKGKRDPSRQGTAYVKNIHEQEWGTFVELRGVQGTRAWGPREVWPKIKWQSGSRLH